jgi:AcrR family transcriptional regulator
MQLFNHPSQSESEVRNRILESAQHLFAQKGFAKTSTRQLAQEAGVAEGTLFRYFDNKKAILVEVVTQGWIELLTDLLTELSEMSNEQAIAQVMRRRMHNLHQNADLMRVCFMEAQFHPELRDRIQSEIITKMTEVVEAFVQTAIARGTYRALNPRVVAQVFLGMFTIAGFSQDTLMDSNASPQVKHQIAETLADIFLHGVLTPESRKS